MKKKPLTEARVRTIARAEIRKALSRVFEEQRPCIGFVQNVQDDYGCDGRKK